MKKLVTMIVCLFATVAVVFADDDKLVTFDQLPQKTQEFINAHFANQSILTTKMESSMFDKNYEVIFENGNNIEFDKNGEWKEVNCRKSEVPIAIVPQQIMDIVAQNYSGNKIIGIERESNGYEVKLSNRLKLTFNQKFSVIDMSMGD